MATLISTADQQAIGARFQVASTALEPFTIPDNRRPDMAQTLNKKVSWLVGCSSSREEFDEVMGLISSPCSDSDYHEKGDLVPC